MKHLQSRRSFLHSAAAVPLVALRANAHNARAPQISCEPNCLSEESAAGFRSILHARLEDAAGCSHPSLIVLPAVSVVTEEQVLGLYREALSGAWVIWENSPVPASERAREQARMLRQTFGVSFAESTRVSSDSPGASGLYVRFSWPHATLTRTFLAVVPVACTESEAIAHYGGVPVAARRRTGKGGIVLLGSMLGPNVRAGEREATQFTTEMFRLLEQPAVSLQA